LTDILERLGKYEDLGLEPSQLAEIDRLYQSKCEEVVALKKEVAEYQQKIADGRMVELPCAFGDTIYDIYEFLENRYAPEIMKYKADAIEIKKDKHGIVFCIESTMFRPEEFGKSVFLSEEEAEQALKESNRKKNENPCINSGCDCYNAEVGGCEMPSEDLMLSCPLERGDK
jgi:hypothetical protein